jgi:hypothetical protein
LEAAGAQTVTEVPDQPEAAAPEVPAIDAGTPDLAPADTDAGEVSAADAASPAMTPSGYAGMCAHYCAALEETNLYACLAGGTAVGDCRQRTAGLTERCLELRCAPGLVTADLCLVQCDALARVYEPACTRPAPAPPCAQPPAEHDRLCRAGCAVM